MKKKIISILAILLVIGGFIANHLFTYAKKTDQILYVNLTPTDVNGVGYGIGDANNGGKHIWNITSYDSDDVDDVSSPQRDLYCVNADYGKTWFGTNGGDGEESTILGYELYYDIQSSDRTTLLTAFPNDTTITNLLNPDGSQYKQLLWIFDNAYIPVEDDSDDETRTEEINKFLEKAGILYDEDNEYYYKRLDEYTIQRYSGDGLTEEDIVEIQRMVIWYFTNNANYNYTAQDSWLTVSKDGGAYNTVSGGTTTTGDTMVSDLYSYLISAANSGVAQYTSANDYKIDGTPVSVNGNNKDAQVTIETQRVGANYIVGPITLQQNNELDYKISLIVNNQAGKPVTNYTYVADEDGNTLEGITDVNNDDIIDANDLVGKTFYISVPRSNIDSVSIIVNVSYTATTKTLWLDGNEVDGTITLNGEQPLVEIVRGPQTLEVELTSKPEEFDLTLKKYVKAITSNEDFEAREPQVSTETLQTTLDATYIQTKEPVVVQDGDEVTYVIRIYNEGDKAGYASKIIDQLPTGLMASNNNPGTVTSKKENDYNLTWDMDTNQIILILDEETPQAIQPYAKTTGLDYDTIEIKCIVTPNPNIEEQLTLTNVAWIAEAYEYSGYDEEQGKDIYIISDNDRDSSTKKSPQVNADVLATDEYSYESEDDDDFEKVVFTPPEKVFDLSLFKYIAAVSKDQTINEGEYITDTKQSTGTYLRAPIPTSVDENGKITYKYGTDGFNKEALAIEPGDYVLYTIRVYNEGDKDAYVSEITDQLPEGLEFVQGLEAAETNGMWTYNEKTRIATTTWYAKGGNAADELEPGTNLLKAFNGTIGEESPDYIEVQILCQVSKDAESGDTLTNYAQISKFSDKDGNNIDEEDDSVPGNSTPENWNGEDDEDTEKLVVQRFDLSLRKFVTSVNDKSIEVSREPEVVKTTTEDGKTVITYKQLKTPLAVLPGDKIIYTIRVYNEGDIKGYASEVKDYLPEYLEYMDNSEINAKYKWQVSDDRRSATTTYLADIELEASENEISYVDVQIECILSKDVPVKQNQTNIAEITKYKYNGTEVKNDADSAADNMKDVLPSDKELPTYKDEEIKNSPYDVPGNEDDDDFEKVYVKQFDLSLKKFITRVNDKVTTAREPQVKIENGTISYEYPEEPVIVHVGDTVIYTIRVYNEGEVSGYATEITDDIPEYLEYLPEHSTNVDYMWKMYDENGNETENTEDAVKLKTTYLSKEDKLINAFDGEKVSYQDIQIAFKVNDPNSNTHIITNFVQISDDSDEDGNEVEDSDSTPDKWIDNDNHKDDDQDTEDAKVEYFDLSLLKFVSKVIVIEDGTEKITETGYNGIENPKPVVKVEVHKKKLNTAVVKFVYGITVTNEGDIPGYATEITDYIPEGLKFDPTDNPEWTDEGNNVISTRQLEDTLLQPGESKNVEVTLTWINGKDNLSTKTNIAEISEDNNEYGVPDKDSTPDNKQEGEDDIDTAEIITAVSTGATKTYFTLALGLLAVIATGIALIKKFVI